MKLSQTDVVTHVENTLRVERVKLARAVDRVEALAELRALLFEFSHRAGTATLTPDDLERSPRDEKERARLTALVNRALPEPQEAHHA